MFDSKEEVKLFWNSASCGEDLYLHDDNLAGYQEQLRVRYELEPYISQFAQFDGSEGKRILEIGVGLGADHQKFAESGAVLSGIDLTNRAVAHTQKRFSILELKSDLSLGDAEALNFSDNTFDEVYSWGVLHHSPRTDKCIDEVWRVLRLGGIARIMVYNKWSIVGLMLWIRYALLRMRPFTTLEEIYSKYLESPGTKAYTKKEAKALFSRFSSISISIELTHGDLLTSAAGQRHRGTILSIAKKIWPRRIIQKLMPGMGLFMLITATK